MQNPLNQIVRTIFGEARLEDVSRDALHLLTVKYPYSAPLHLLYARRLRDMGDSRYAEAVSLAALHFSNPHWLQHQLTVPLSEESSAESASLSKAGPALDSDVLAENREMEALPPTITPEEGDHPTATETETTAFDTSEIGASIEPEMEHPSSNMPDEEGTNTVGVLPEALPEEEVTSLSQEETAPIGVSDQPFSETPPADVRSEEEAGTEIPGQVALSKEDAFVAETTSATADVSLASQEHGGTDTGTPDMATTLPAGSPVEQQGEEGRDNAVTRLESVEPAENMPEVEASELIHVEMPEDAEAIEIGDATNIAVLQEVGDTSASSTWEDEGAMPPDTASEGVPDVSMASNAPTVGTDAAVAIEPLPVEPLHLTDYLASQGIVVGSELELPSEVRGERSFTGWLRTMKRFQPDRNSQALSEQEEDSIRSEAEASNLDEDVVTEAMAEVYARQGLISKAIDIYDKLSLLDPDRSATFAARISQLKGQMP